MSLLRLLTAGKSLIGLKNPARRYMLSQPGALPKFNSKRNPFRATIRLESATSPQGEAVASTGPTRATASTCIALSAEERTALPPASAQAGAPQGTVPDQLNGAGDRKPRLGSIFSWIRPKATATPPVARAAKSMVQCELSLDTVRVVRNDLSDSDIEIVSPKMRAPAKSETEVPVQSIAQRVPLESAWNRVGRQLFGASNT